MPKKLWPLSISFPVEFVSILFQEYYSIYDPAEK